MSASPLPRDGRAPRPAALGETEARLPIPSDVLVLEVGGLPVPGVWSRARRVILLRAELGTERPFTLAHECAHIMLGHHGGLPESVTEPEADALATELLAAAEGVIS